MANRTNKLAVDLEINEKAGAAALDRFRQKLGSTESEINDAGKKSQFAAAFSSQISQVEKRALGLQKTFKDLGTVQKGKPFTEIEKSAQAAFKQSNDLQVKIRQIESLASRTTNPKALESLTAAAKTANKQLDQLERQANRLQQSKINQPSAKSGLLSELGGSGLPGSALLAGGAAAAAIAVTGAAVSKGIDLAEKAIEKTIEQTRANRLLSSSATEAGVSFAFLAEKNEKFADSLGLSKVAGAGTTARIQQLATYSGKPGNVDALLKGFADLDTAKGIEPGDLRDLIGTILSGQDEGLNRLGISDPGKLYQAYADKVHKSVDALSQFEKVNAAVEAVLQKSSIFKGAAEARMNSLEGAVSRTSAQWQNFTTALSVNFARSKEVSDVLGGLSQLMKRLGLDADDLQKKISKGFGSTTLAKQEAAKFGYADRIEGLFGLKASVETRLLTGFSGGKGVFQSGYDLLTNQTGKAREDFILRQINAQKLLDSRQEKGAQDQAKALREILRLEKERADLTAYQNKNFENLKELVGDPRTSTEDLRFKLKHFSNQAYGISPALGNNTPQLDKKQREDYYKLLTTEISDRAAKPLNLRLNDPKIQQNAKELRKIAADAASSVELLPDKAQDIIEVASLATKKTVEDAKNKILDMEKTAVSMLDSLAAKRGADNPFVSLFSEADQSIKNVTESTKGLSAELQQSFLLMQKQQNSLALFKTRLDNDLNVFDLREDAKKFRSSAAAQSPVDYDAFSKKYAFNKYYLPNDPNLRNQANNPFSITGRLIEATKGNLTDQQKAEIYNRAVLEDGFADRRTNFQKVLSKTLFSNVKKKGIENPLDYVANLQNPANLPNDPSRVNFSLPDTYTADQKGIISYLARQMQKPKTVEEQQAGPIQQRLNEQIKIIDNLRSTNKTVEAGSEADKRIIALTAGLNPDDLSPRLREAAASSREREAIRLENAEKAAADQRAEQIAYAKQIAEDLRKLIPDAEGGGLEALIRIIDETGGSIDVSKKLGRRPNPDDVKKQFEK